MKTITLLLVSVLWFSAKAQETPTAQQAKKYLESHINSEIDIPEYNKAYALLKEHKPGEIIIDGKNIYKIIEATTVMAYNAGYIFLDPKKIPEAEIKQLTDEILNLYNTGTPFSDLCKKYSMDKNPKAAEFKFTEGQMVAPFEKAVKEHNAGEVFTVSNPEKSWFYIVKKNADEFNIKAIRTEYATFKSS